MMICIRNNQGDTLVEVLLATVILSIVLAGSYTLSNKASTINQQSQDRTRAAQFAQEQIELIRAARDSYDPTDPTTQLWDEIKLKEHPGSSIPDLGTQCNDLSTLASNRTNEFNIDSGTFTISDNIALRENFYRVWVETISVPGNEYWDFHVFTCWEGIGRAEGQKLKLVLRLEENNE